MPGVRARPAWKEPTVTGAMTHVCCPRCRLRFTPAAAYISACPQCGDAPQAIVSLEGTFGFRLVGPEDLSEVFLDAVAVSLTDPRAPQKLEPSGG
jgi:hypothetical protein